MHGEVDPAVLAALPPSMQLDLLVQVRFYINWLFIFGHGYNLSIFKYFYSDATCWYIFSFP